MNIINIINSAAKYIENEDDFQKFLQDCEFNLDDLEETEVEEILSTVNNKYILGYIINNSSIDALLNCIETNKNYTDIATNLITNKICNYAESAINSNNIIFKILFKSYLITWDKTHLTDFMNGKNALYINPIYRHITNTVLNIEAIEKLFDIYAKNENLYKSTNEHGCHPAYAKTQYAIGYNWEDGILMTYEDMGRPYRKEYFITKLIEKKLSYEEAKKYNNEFVGHVEPPRDIEELLKSYGFSTDINELKEDFSSNTGPNSWYQMLGETLIGNDVWKKL